MKIAVSLHYLCHNKHSSVIIYLKHNILMITIYERWSRGHKARGLGHKNISRTDPLEAKDTDASVLQKKGFQKIFSSNLKNRFPTKFQRFKK